MIRYITNEPKLDVTEGNVKAGYGTTAHGDPNSNVTAVLNLPLIDDTMAARAVIYNDHRGGYIDNVPATFTRKATDVGIHYAYYPIGCDCGTPSRHLPGGGPDCFGVPPGSPVINNSNIAENDINPVTYRVARVEVLYKFNDDWDVLISQSYQNMDAEGCSTSSPTPRTAQPLQPLQVTLFNPSSTRTSSRAPRGR